MDTPIAERTLPTGQSLAIVQGDITTESVDAIVNAANTQLQHGGGVAQAIQERGGDSIRIESNAWVRRHGPVAHTRPAWTKGGRLPAKYVIHAVGPRWGDGSEDEKLAQAVRGALQLADELGARSIALPAISTGIFGFPVDRAAGIILESIEDYFLSQPASVLQVVRIVLFNQPAVEAFLAVWKP